MDWLARHFEPVPARGVTVGIGDDAAVLSPLATAWVWTVDTQVEGTHFERDWLSLPDLGRRGFHAAASDLAAMGATPLAALSGLVVPAREGTETARAIARGQKRASAELACPIVGGNLSRGGELSVTTTLVGTVRRPLLRSGAKAGDEIWLLGEVGLAAASLAWITRARLRGGAQPSAADLVALRRCRTRLQRPKALVEEGVGLVGVARSAIDVSDGLAGDLGHLVRASQVRGVVEEVALRAVLRPELQRASRLLRREPLELALFGGEDYALLATGPARRRPSSARRIGRIEPGRGAFLETMQGTLEPLASAFDHFGRGRD